MANENSRVSNTSRPATGADINDLQQKISDAEKELNMLKLELDLTKKQAKQAEVYAQESGRTNRKLKTEIQTLTDMSSRKDRQAENSKATAFFYEGQVKKYKEEIETARQGMGHLKELDDQLNQTKAEKAALQKTSTEESLRVKITLKAMQDKHKEDKERLKTEIKKANAELEQVTTNVLRIQQEMQKRIDDELKLSLDIQNLEREHQIFQQRQLENVKGIYVQVEQLREKIEQSEVSILVHEEKILDVKQEMDVIMRQLRSVDQDFADTI